MAKDKTGVATAVATESVGAAGNEALAPKPQSRSLAIASRGVRTSREFASLMSAMMSDVIEGGITPAVANAAVNAGGKLLKAVELQMRYGRTDGSGKILDLTADDDRERRKAELRGELRALEGETTGAYRDPSAG